MMFRSPRDVVFVPKAPSVYRKYDETAELYGCDICTDGGWTSETEVEIHKTKVHYRKYFINEMRKRDDYCYICIKKCPNKESVVKHIRTEHLLSTETCLRVEREIFVCDKCSSIFFNKQNLCMHLRYAHLNMRNMKHIKCIICMKKIQVRSMQAHFYSHGLLSVTTCRICLSKYYNIRALAEHLKTHPYYLKCDICCYEFCKVGAFQNHILSKHKNSVKINSMKDTKRNKNKLMGIKNKDKKKKKITTERATTVENLLEDSAMDDTNLTDNNEKDIDKDLIALKYDDSLIKVEDLISDQVKDDPDSEDNRRKKEIGNSAFINNYLMADDVIKNESTNSDLMIDEVMSDSNLMTVIEISDEDVTATDTAANTNLTENIKTGKDFVINDITETEVKIESDTNLTDNVNPVKDLVSNDITVTEAKIESDTNLTGNVKPIKDLMSDEVIITKANTDNVVSKPVKDSEDFKRFFVPDSPTFRRLQQIVGIRGIRLSNDVHICILCREICVGFEEMRSHVDEHSVIVEKSYSYECSCGEKFTTKIFLEYHAIVSKHVISKLTD